MAGLRTVSIAASAWSLDTTTACATRSVTNTVSRLKETHMASGMVTGRAPSFALAGLENLRKNWGWVLALGIALIVLGTVALGAAVFTTVASVMLFGWLLIIAGVAEGGTRLLCAARGSGFFLDLLTGVLYLVVGLMFIVQPLRVGRDADAAAGRGAGVRRS